jgi:hypothetical protein
MSTQAETRNPEEAGGLRRFPIAVAIWLAVGAAITVVFPGLARSIGEGLARREGLTTDER